MKGSHLYDRMSNPTAVKGYLNMIKTNDMHIVKALVGNLTLEADDHPRYPTILQAFQERMQSENNKE